MQNEKIHKRGRYTAEFKEKVALEALNGAKTHAQIASEYGISPDLVKVWKSRQRICLANVSAEADVKNEKEKKEESIANLERLLGKRKFELDWLSKKSQGVGTVAQRCQLLDIEGKAPSSKRQCELLGLARSSTYYKKRVPKDEPAAERAIEQLYEEDATLGRRRLPILLQRRYGIEIGAKKCQRLKKKLGLRTIYPHRDTSAPNPRAEKEPYLLKDMQINEVDQVWTSDITYIQIERCNYYLCVVMDWDSRFVLGWSMDGKGRWADNIIMERFWRTYTHEYFLHREPKSLEEAIELTSAWMEYYNRERPHSSLKNYSPLMYRENHASPLPANFGAIFPLRHGSRRFAPRPRYARDAMPTLQNRAKNGLTSEGIE